jgi:hypothetical protein
VAHWESRQAAKDAKIRAKEEMKGPLRRVNEATDAGAHARSTEERILVHVLQEGGSEVAMDLDPCVHHDGCELVGPNSRLLHTPSLARVLAALATWRLPSPIGPIAALVASSGMTFSSLAVRGPSSPP